MVNTLLNQLRFARDGYAINRSAVKGCIGVLQDLPDAMDKTVYQTDFEPVFLKESQVYFATEAQRLLEMRSASEYLTRVRPLRLYQLRPG